MKFTIANKEKKHAFIAIFDLLRNNSSLLNINFKEDHIYIQGMDRSHVCLFDVKIMKDWFSGEYTVSEGDTQRICINPQIFYSILSSSNEEHNIQIHYDGNPDNLNIDLLVEEDNKNKNVSKREFSNYFKIPLMDDDYEYLHIPDTEYDAEFSLSAKKINEIVNKMVLFGDSLKVSCNEENIDLFSTGVCGEMKVNIPIDDICEFSINEGDEINLSYNLAFLQKMCLTTKISNTIDFSLSKGSPMKIKYDLTSNSTVVFYIAPKIDDNDDD